MSRRTQAPKRTILPDPKYGDRMLAKFMNVIMLDGKKSAAEQIVYGAFDLISERSGEEPLEVFKKAMDNIRPMLEVKSRRVGGSTYQVPVEVRNERRTQLAMRWLIGFARSRPENTFSERLAAELLMASKNEGPSIKKREDTHRMAEANRAFAHCRW